MISKAQAADFNFLKTGYDTATTAATTAGTTASVAGLVTRVVDILLFVAGALAIIYLIYSGILYISSAGNADAAKKGQQGVLNAAIGLIIIVLAYFIAQAVANEASKAVVTVP